MANKKFEIRAIRNGIDDYLGILGWLGIEYREQFKSEEVIKVPTVAVRYLPSTKESLQLGGKGGEDLIRRVVQVDCYMETEDRAEKITDDIMDFFDLETIIIKDQNDVTLGTVICPNSESIYSEVIPPLLTDPKVLRWRGVIRATLESHYYAP